MSSAIVGRTVSVRSAVPRTQAPRSLNPFTELDRDFGGTDAELFKVISDFLPLHFGQITLILSELENALDRTVTVDEVQASIGSTGCGG